jgi:hypothetical protein
MSVQAPETEGGGTQDRVSRECSGSSQLAVHLGSFRTVTRPRVRISEQQHIQQPFTFKRLFEAQEAPTTPTGTAPQVQAAFGSH